MVQLPSSKQVNCIVLREAIHLGQSIENFKIVLFNNTQVVNEINGTTIGRKRIVTFPVQTITSFKVILKDRFGNDNVSGIAAYLLEEKLVER
jgi:alpha-L-fucosidase